MPTITEQLIRFAKLKKGTNVKFRGKKEYTKGHASGKGECQDLVDKALDHAGGRMGAVVASPRKGMLAIFNEHKTTLTLKLFGVQGSEKVEFWMRGAEMKRGKHIAIVDDVFLSGKKVWVWEQNVTKDKKVVRQPVRNDKHYIAAKKTFKSSSSVSRVKKFLHMKLDHHASDRARPKLKDVDWSLVGDWMDSGYDIFVQIELKSSGKVKFHEVKKDERK